MQRGLSRDASTPRGGSLRASPRYAQHDIALLPNPFVMLSEAGRAARSSQRSRSIPTPIPNPEVFNSTVTFITARQATSRQSSLHARPTLLLRLHPGKPVRHAVHRSNRQSSQAHLPAQIPPLRRIHGPLRSGPTALLGVLRRRPQGPGPRKAVERMDTRKENRLAGTPQS